MKQKESGTMNSELITWMCSVVAQADLSLTWSKTPMISFLVMSRPEMCFRFPDPTKFFPRPLTFYCDLQQNYFELGGIFVRITISV